MPARPGTRPPNAGKGRKVGSTNKHTAAIKEMIEEALVRAGGVEYLIAQSAENPAAFMGLVGKILPKDINASVTGQMTLHSWLAQAK